jgi:TPP-dependent pyruvate/acetoin dehydrogenase alpha subunit
MSGGVGAQYTPAAGWAQAIAYKQEVLSEGPDDAIALVLGGDASVATGGFWSALTIATTQQLPLLIYIEDNGYGISVPSEYQTPGRDIAATSPASAASRSSTATGPSRNRPRSSSPARSRTSASSASLPFFG